MTTDVPGNPVPGSTPFDDLKDYIAIPRVSGLRLSPDGSWLAASVQTLSADRKKYVASIWRIDAAGGPPRRLTRSAEGENVPRFLPDGSLLFTSKRPDPDRKSGGGTGDGDEKPALWLLPPGGGEARMVVALPGGITGVETAANSDAVIVTGSVLPGAAAEDERRRKAREDAGVSAILHESMPVRHWDHDLGPDDPRLFAVDVAGGPDQAPRDLTPDAGRALHDQAAALSPDGRSIAAGWWRWVNDVQTHAELALIDLATGERATLSATDSGQVPARAADLTYGNPVFSPDGSSVVCVRVRLPSREEPEDRTLVLLPAVDTGWPETDLLPEFDRWPDGPVWDLAGQFVYFTADDGGRRPVFAVDLATREVSKVTADDGHYTDLSAAPDGTALYALRDAMGEPPAPVRIDLATGAFTRLDAPGAVPPPRGRLSEITAAADDGHPLRAWLVLPDGADEVSQAPLLLWVHGGPMSSWNGWSWRWNPWLMAAKGYAVLLPDPALSTGYGQEFIARGHTQWGPRTFADIMAITDAAVARDDIDGSRTAMMGGSFGGYMANWIAGHTGRFRAIVNHAGLWALDQMFGTTDTPHFWQREFGAPLSYPDRYEKNAPHVHIANISTPMLVIHGNLDYRVPLGEALRLWSDLLLHGKTAKFLYFPDENHWILRPGNVLAWYQTVYAFLAEHVLGAQWQPPDLL